MAHSKKVNQRKRCGGPARDRLGLRIPEDLFLQVGAR
jgi:hypothetical protein